MSSPNSQHPRSPSPPPAVQPPSSAQHWHSSACKTDEVTPHPMREVTFVNGEHCCWSRPTTRTKSPGPVPHHHTPPSCTPPAPDVRSLLLVTGHKPAPSHQVQFRITTHLLPAHHRHRMFGHCCWSRATNPHRVTRSSSASPHTSFPLCFSASAEMHSHPRNMPRDARSPTNLTPCINHDADCNWDGKPIRCASCCLFYGAIMGQRVNRRHDASDHQH